MTGWRVLLRVARRDALRHRGRSLLVALLVALPVAAMTLALTLGRTAELTPDQQAAGVLGQADLSISGSGVEPSQWQVLLPRGSRWLRVAHEFNGVAVVRGDELYQSSVVETDLGDPLMAGRYEVVAGRPPAGPDEMVISEDLAGALGVEAGDRLELRRPRRTVTVTGTAITPTSLGVPFVAVAPGWSGPESATSGETSGEWLVDLSGGDVATVAAGLEQAFPAPESNRAPDAADDPGYTDQPRYLNVVSRSHLLAGDYSNRTGEVSATFVAGALALVWTGAVSAAAFAVGARRRLREVGLVAASGGAPRQLAGMGLADGVVFGGAGAAAGILGGLAGAAALQPQVGWIFGHVSGPFRVPVAGLAGAAAGGFLAAVLAAVAPALGAARVPVLASLAGLRPTPARHRSWLTLGLVALSAGLALCWRGSATHSQTAVLVGVLLAVVGVAATSGPLLSALGRVAGHAPLAMRLAARDASRARSRVAPATVAAMLALAGAVGGMTMVYSARAETLRGYVPLLGDDQLLMSFEAGKPVPPQELADLVDAMKAAMPGSAVGVVFQADVLGEGSDAGLMVVGGDEVQGLAVGDADTLDAVGASSARGAFDQGRVVALGRRIDGGQLQLSRPPVDGTFFGPLADGRFVGGRGFGAPPGSSALGAPLHSVPAVEVDVPRREAAPAYLLSQAAAESLGLDVRASGVLVRAAGPVSESDLRRAQLTALDAVPSASTYLQREEGPCCGEEAAVAATMLGMATVVALLVVALVTALAREEFLPHLSTLAAVGAAPRTHRRLGAAQAGLMTGLAGVLAVPAGLLPAVALLAARPPALGTGVGDVVRSSNLVVVPWLLIAALVVGITTAGALTGGLLGRGRRGIR
ncbi:MAG: FtsX-like permease family protein [Acidimicrobiales bacterium]